MSKELDEMYERINKYKKYGRKYIFADYMIIQNKEILRMCNAIVEYFEETFKTIYTLFCKKYGYDYEGDFTNGNK